MKIIKKDNKKIKLSQLINELNDSLPPDIIAIKSSFHFFGWFDADGIEIIKKKSKSFFCQNEVYAEVRLDRDDGWIINCFEKRIEDILKKFGNKYNFKKMYIY